MIRRRSWRRWRRQNDTRWWRHNTTQHWRCHYRLLQLTVTQYWWRHDGLTVTKESIGRWWCDDKGRHDDAWRSNADGGRRQGSDGRWTDANLKKIDKVASLTSNYLGPRFCKGLYIKTVLLPFPCLRSLGTPSVLSWLNILDRIYKLTGLDYFWTKVVVCANLVPTNNSDK